MCDPSNISTGDVSVVAEQHIDATDGEIGPPGLKNSGDKAIAAADVEHAGGGRSKLGKPSGDGFDSAVERPASRARLRWRSMEYAVYNGTRVRKRGKRAIYVPCVARNATPWRASLAQAAFGFRKRRALSG